MKRRLLTLTLAVLTVGLLGSCSKINERLDNLDKRVDGIENEQIASINTQITSINSSIADLGQIRSDISSLKQSAENHSVDIFNLEEADRALADRILNLEDYLDEVLPKYAETEWVKATFSTLEQYEATCDTIAKIDARIGVLDAKLSKDIQACADSLTKWVNKTFEGYYTAAQMDAKLAQMKSDIDSARAAGKITDAKADSLAGELAKVKPEVDTAKANIRKEYRAAIDTAIKTSEGKLTKALQEKISDVNGKIESLTTRVGKLETSVASLTGRVDKLEGMIQSVTIVPAYSDGSVEAVDGVLELNLIVSPSSAAKGLTKEKVNILLNSVTTKAASVDTVDTDKITDFVVDKTKGTVEIKADISDKIEALQPQQLLTVAVNVTNGGLSDFTTEFVPVFVAGPAIPEGALKGVFSVSATKKVYFSKGNLYWDGDSFEFEANQYDFQNSWSTSHVSHFFWSKTASVVYAETYSDGSAAGSDVFFTNAETETAKSDFTVNGVTGQYRTLSKDEWAYLFSNHSYKWAPVNGVNGYVIAPDDFSGELASSYADDAALAADNLVFLPAAGSRYGSDVYSVGVIGGYWSSTADGGDNAYYVNFKSSYVNPDFYVNRYYGYSVRLVTSGAAPEPVVPVTGVTLNKTELSLAADKSETLVATVQPENATDKSVTWSTSDESVATVDNTGKVTAVAVGQADITVTTTDGSKIATCAVNVKSLPAGALNGEFSVSDTKKVYFSQGNLWADGNKALHFEANQYDFNISYESSHVSHFTWSSTVEAAVGNSNSGSNLFCDESHKVSVDDGEAIYYALSKDEWKYLINKNADNNIRKDKYKSGVKVCGKTNCLILVPDECLNGYSFDNTKTNYTAEEWATAEAAGLVCLPAAGYRNGSDVYGVGDGGYWSSTAYDSDYAYYVYFSSNVVYPDYNDLRNYGFSVRLITDASVTPAPTPTTTGTAKRTGDIDVNWVQLWENGPKFAEYNVGASSATETGTTMTFTDAIKAGAEYVWGSNWCTPSKADLDELLKAATSEESTKVKCEYTKENSTWGFKFTGKETGYTSNSVFFPAQNGVSYDGYAYYWSATASGSQAWCMDLGHGSGRSNSWREVDQFISFLVRPVLKN